MNLSSFIRGALLASFASTTAVTAAAAGSSIADAFDPGVEQASASPTARKADPVSLVVVLPRDAWTMIDATRLAGAIDRELNGGSETSHYASTRRPERPILPSIIRGTRMIDMLNPDVIIRVSRISVTGSHGPPNRLAAPSNGLTPAIEAVALGFAYSVECRTKGGTMLRWAKGEFVASSPPQHRSLPPAYGEEGLFDVVALDGGAAEELVVARGRVVRPLAEHSAAVNEGAITRFISSLGDLPYQVRSSRLPAGCAFLARQTGAARMTGGQIELSIEVHNPLAAMHATGELVFAVPRAGHPGETTAIVRSGGFRLAPGETRRHAVRASAEQCGIDLDGSPIERQTALATMARRMRCTLHEVTIPDFSTRELQ